MEIPKNTKIEKACGNDPTRENLSDPYLDLSDSADPRLVATDGRILVALRVATHEKDTAGYIPRAAIVAARKAGGPGVVIANGAAEIFGGATFPRDNEHRQFPDWRQLVPKAHEKPASISFNAKLLSRIVDACGGNVVTLTFDASDPGVMVKVESSDAIAVLMPVQES